MKSITSRQNALVTRIRNARRERRTTRKYLVLDGRRVIADAQQSGVTIDTVLVAAAAFKSDPTIKHLCAQFDSNTTTLATCSERIMAAVSTLRSPSQVVALGSHKPLAFENLISSKRNNFIVMPLAVQDPGNLGAIIRSAVAAGSSGIIVDRSSADPYNWKALRGSMGCTFRLPIANTDDTFETLRQARRHGWVIVATSPHTGTSIYDATLNGRVILLVGNEGSGLESKLRQEVDLTLSIPMSGKIESLNVAVATAIIAYEIKRQRNRK